MRSVGDGFSRLFSIIGIVRFIHMLVREELNSAQAAAPVLSAARGENLMTPVTCIINFLNSLPINLITSLISLSVTPEQTRITQTCIFFLKRSRQK